MLNLKVLNMSAIFFLFFLFSFVLFRKHFNFVATIINANALVNGIYRIPIISVLGLYGCRNIHCLQKEVPCVHKQICFK